MLTERLFSGIKEADSTGSLFKIALLPEVGWRFKSDEVYVSFHIVELDKVKKVILPKILILESVFATGESEYTITEGEKGIYATLDNTVLYVKTFSNVRITGIEVSIARQETTVSHIFNNPNTGEEVKSLMDGVIVEGSKVSLLKDPLTGVVIGFTGTERDIWRGEGEYKYSQDMLDWIETKVPRFDISSAIPYDTEEERDHFLSAVLLTKGENEYLDEWLRVNRKAGFDHFYIYDNNDEENRIKRDDPDITIIPFQAKRQLQYEAYDHWLRHYEHETSWVAFIDTDEMFEGNVANYVREKRGAAEIIVRWTNHGANGIIERKDRSNSFSDFAEEIAPNEGNYTKVIIRPETVEKAYVHSHQLTAPFDVVQPSEVEMENKIKLHHFVTRSLQEYVEKITRGSCDPVYLRKLKEFLKWNPDMKEEFEAYLISNNLKEDLSQ